MIETMITDPITLELIHIPAGEFLMGSDPFKDTMADIDEQPQQHIYVPEFYIGKFPITNEQYAVFIKATGHRVPGHWEDGEIPAGKENHPVVCVSWHDAVAFCQWLSEATGQLFRLPTEAEWEKAARGPDGRIYPWGNEWDKTKLNSDAGGSRDTTPVGSYSPGGDSPYGVADMAGNVWEWTHGLCRPYPYLADDGREEPQARGSRAVRGGSWFISQWYARVSYRFIAPPNYFSSLYGFRVSVAPVLSAGIDRKLGEVNIPFDGQPLPVDDTGDAEFDAAIELKG